MTAPFVAESNRIEGITRPPTRDELNAHRELWALDRIDVSNLEHFVYRVASQTMRCRPGMDVTVGGHRPPPGGPRIETDLRALLDAIYHRAYLPYGAHQVFERLHPFMDGNGRSGRALWAWHMRRDGHDPFALPFLHRWYYQSLDAERRQANDGDLPRDQEWYPRECEFCTREAALACTDPSCRARRLGEDRD